KPVRENPVLDNPEQAFLIFLYLIYSYLLVRGFPVQVLPRQGKYVGGYAPYGYVLHPEIRNKLKLDPEAAEVVRRVFNEALKGRNTSQIALSLNDDNISTPRSEEHTSELQSRFDLVCRLLLEK